MTRESKDLLVGLDIGTSKVVTIVAEMHSDGEYEVRRHRPARVQRAEEGRGRRHRDDGGVDPGGARGGRADGRAARSGPWSPASPAATSAASTRSAWWRSRTSEVTEADVLRVTETAKAVNIPTDQQILHVLPQEYIIDGQEDIREPVGMSGVRLDVKVHIVTGAVSAVQNIIKCVRRCGLEVQDLILQPLASSSCGADGRREGTRRGAGRHRRRHHRHRRLRRRLDPAFGGAADRRRPDHQRHRDGAAHADGRCRGHQAAPRPGQAGAGQPERQDRGARHRRSRPALAVASRRWPP